MCPTHVDFPQPVLQLARVACDVRLPLGGGYFITIITYDQSIGRLTPREQRRSVPLRTNEFADGSGPF